MSRYILNADYLEDEIYDEIISQLPYYYTDFPEELSENKLISLCEKKKVRLNEKSFNSAEDNIDVLVSLLANNIEEYLKSKPEYPIEDNIREKLIVSDLDYKYKIEIVYDLSHAGISNSEELPKAVTYLLLDSKSELGKVDDSVLEVAILNGGSLTNSIKLLTKCILVWDKTRIMKAIAGLPEPYSDISSYGKRPKIPNNEYNLEFAEYLNEYNLISSIKVKEKTIQINTFNLDASD